MKINSKMLSIPPYISTSWENVLSLQLEELTGNLIISLQNGGKVSIPHLSGETIEEAFNAHAEFIEHSTKKVESSMNSGMSFSLTPGGINPEHFRPVMQHDSNQKNSPDLHRGCSLFTF